MIPRSQHFRDRAPFPFDRSGKMRILKEAVLKRFLSTAGSRAHYAGKQPNASIKKHDRGRFSARQDDITDTNLLDVASFEDSFIESLETAAQNTHPWSRRQFPHARL